MSVNFPCGMIVDSGAGGDANPIAGVYVTDPLGLSRLALKRLSNVIQGTGTGTSAADAYRNDLQLTDCDAMVTLPVVDNTANATVAIGVRCTPGISSVSKQYMTVRSSSTTVKLFKYAASTFTQLGTTQTVSVGAGNKLGIRASGTSITAYTDTGSGSVAATNATATDSTVTGPGYTSLEIDGPTYTVSNYTFGRIGSMVPPPLQNPLVTR